MSQDMSYPPPDRLRYAREAAGLHIAALAAALKVPVRKLEALEAGRYEELPDLTFARALASSVCRHLKVDAGPVLEQIPLGRQPALGDTDTAINAPFKQVEERAALPAVGWLRRPAVFVSLALLVGAAVLWWMPNLQLNLPESTGGHVTETVGTNPAVSSGGSAVTEQVEAPVTTTPLENPVAPAAENVSTSVSGTVTEPSVAAAPVPATPELAASAPTPSASSMGEVAQASPSGSLLHIQATGDSWIEVVDGQGKTQVQRMLRRGDVLDFSSTPPYSVVVGRADGVSVTVRGQAFDTAPYARNSVARFQVK